MFNVFFAVGGGWQCIKKVNCNAKWAKIVAREWKVGMVSDGDVAKTK